MTALTESSSAATLHLASTPDDYAAFAVLIRQYLTWARQRYQAHEWFVTKVFGHQSLDTELGTLPAKYGPPHGKTLLATLNDVIVGGCAYQILPDGSCEMKRLFVSDSAKGHGVGRQLCETIIGLAKDDGFMLMRLDTGNLLTEAIAMYKSLGFRDCAPHLEYPADLLPFLVFMELPLDSSKNR